MAIFVNEGTNETLKYANAWTPGQSDTTFAAWLYITSSSTAQIPGPFILEDSNPTGARQSFYLVKVTATNRRVLAYQIDTAGGYTASKAEGTNLFPIDEWFHFALTHDATTTPKGNYQRFSFYVNGVLQTTLLDSTAGFTGNYASGDGDYVMGVNPDGITYRGDVARAGAGFWDRILSAGEITSLSKGFSPRFFPNGLKWAPLEANVSHIYDRISGAQDASSSSPTNQAHPYILEPAVLPLLAAEVGGIIPLIMHNRQLQARA